MRTPPGTPHSGSRRGRGRLLAASATAALLLSTAAALAAAPKHGAHFTGTSSETKIVGFSAPVSFAVSANGKTLTNFRYSTLGCFGAGGFRPGVDYYTQPEAIIKVGTIKVSSGGRFSAPAATYSYKSSFGVSTVSTSKVTGTFTRSKAAKGTIVFS